MPVHSNVALCDYWHCALFTCGHADCRSGSVDV